MLLLNSNDSHYHTLGNLTQKMLPPKSGTVTAVNLLYSSLTKPSLSHSFHPWNSFQLSLTTAWTWCKWWALLYWFINHLHRKAFGQGYWLRRACSATVCTSRSSSCIGDRRYPWPCYPWPCYRASAWGWVVTPKESFQISNTEIARTTLNKDIQWFCPFIAPAKVKPAFPL